MQLFRQHTKSTNTTITRHFNRTAVLKMLLQFLSQPDDNGLKRHIASEILTSQRRRVSLHGNARACCHHPWNSYHTNVSTSLVFKDISDHSTSDAVSDIGDEQVVYTNSSKGKDLT